MYDYDDDQGGDCGRLECRDCGSPDVCTGGPDGGLLRQMLAPFPRLVRGARGR